MSSVFATLALLALVAAGLSTMVGWQRGAALAAPWVVVGIMGTVIAGLPWSQWLHRSPAILVNNGTSTATSASCLAVVVAGHVALLAWLFMRRFFPRFTDSRARSRERRQVDDDRRRR